MKPQALPIRNTAPPQPGDWRRHPAAMTPVDPVIDHIDAVLAASARHLLAARRDGLDESDRQATKALDEAADTLFLEVERFLTDRRPTTVEGAAALLSFASSPAGAYAMPRIASDGGHFLRRLMRVCADALAAADG